MLEAPHGSRLHANVRVSPAAHSGVNPQPQGTGQPQLATPLFGPLAINAAPQAVLCPSRATGVPSTL